MKILQVNSHHKNMGGAERYYFDLTESLRENGHKIAFFSTIENGNKRTQFKKYFIKKLNFKKNNVSSLLFKFSKIFYNFEARRKISKLLDDFKPDIVHLQNTYYYISSSIIGPIRRRGIPIIQTVHDYQLISPNVVMHHDGKICEIIKPNKFYKALIHRCVKHSYMASLMAVVTIYFQNLNKYKDKIDRFITPSKFMKHKMVEYGYPADKIIVLKNFLNDTFLKQRPSKNTGKYVLYYGRICEAKGTFLLLEVAKVLSDIQFVIAGNFEDEQVKTHFFKIVKKYNLKNVRYHKFASGNTLERLIRDCKLTVLPSLWYENQPYSVIESYSMGKPVVASRIGGIPEIVVHKKTGLLFEPGSATDFRKNLISLWDNPKLIDHMGKNAKNYAFKNFSVDNHYKRIMEMYLELTQNKR